MIPYISIIIPIFNEESNIDELWRRLYITLKNFQKTTDRYWEVIFIDDGSYDNSLPLVKKIIKHEPTVSIIELNRNYGQHAAILSAFSIAKGQIIITLDADLQNSPEEIPKFIKQIESGFDIVSGQRKKRFKNDNLFRLISSKITNLVARKLTNVNLHDYGCMFRAYRKNVVDLILRHTSNHAFIPILANYFAKNITEIPIEHTNRTHGKSKYSLIKLIKLQFDLMTTYSNRLLHLVNTISILISLFSIIFGIIFFIYNVTYQHYTNSLLAVMIILIGIQMLLNGLTGEYTGRIYQKVHNKPNYIIRKIYRKNSN